MLFCLYIYLYLCQLSLFNEIAINCSHLLICIYLCIYLFIYYAFIHFLYIIHYYTFTIYLYAFTVVLYTLPIRTFTCLCFLHIIRTFTCLCFLHSIRTFTCLCFLYIIRTFTCLCFYILYIVIHLYIHLVWFSCNVVLKPFYTYLFTLFTCLLTTFVFHCYNCIIKIYTSVLSQNVLVIFSVNLCTLNIARQ